MWTGPSQRTLEKEQLEGNKEELQENLKKELQEGLKMRARKALRTIVPSTFDTNLKALLRKALFESEQESRKFNNMKQKVQQ